MLMFNLVNCLVSPLIVSASLSSQIKPTTDHPLNFTLSLTDFAECAGIGKSQISVWEDNRGEYMLTPTSITINFDFDKWLDCVDAQDVGDLVSVSDGTNTEGYTLRSEPGDLLNWSGFHYVGNQKVTNIL